MAGSHALWHLRRRQCTLVTAHPKFSHSAPPCLLYLKYYLDLIFQMTVTRAYRSNVICVCSVQWVDWSHWLSLLRTHSHSCLCGEPSASSSVPLKCSCTHLLSHTILELPLTLSPAQRPTCSLVTFSPLPTSRGAAFLAYTNERDFQWPACIT